MLSKAKNKLLQSLKLKKFRDEEGLFVAEGHKIADEVLIAGYPVHWIAATPEWIATSRQHIGSLDVFEISPEELQKISFLAHPQQVLMVLKKPESKPWTTKPSGPVLVLDGVQDPGNLGTILRLCDWFGIPHLLASPDTADVYNPKVIQASMGSFLRVPVQYASLPETILQFKIKSLYGTFMDGNSLYATDFEDDAWIVMGNEGNGISEELSTMIPHRINIPAHPDSGAESLNVSIATAITLAAFRR